MGSREGRTVQKNRLASLNLRIRNRLVRIKFFEQTAAKEKKVEVLLAALKQVVPSEADAIIPEIARSWKKIEADTSSKHKGYQITEKGLELNGRLRSRLSAKNEKRLSCAES